MNVYALIPLVAAIAYVPLLVTTFSSRPWQRQQKLFALFLIAAVMWSLSDLLLRSDFLRQYDLFLGKLIVVMFTLTAVQFHCFVSSFFAPGQRRLLPIAYGTLVAVITLAALGYTPKEIVVTGSKLYPVYGIGVLVVILPLMTLAIRNIIILWRRLKTLDNPVLHNQIVSLILTLFVLVTFGLATQLPLGRELPVIHFGNAINAFILSYSAIRHQLVDIRTVLRRGLAWMTLGIIGTASYVILLAIIHTAFNFDLSITAMLAITLIAALVAIFIYKLRGLLFVTMGKAFGGPSYDYRQQLSDFASKIHNIFTLKEQGAELLTLVTKATGCNKAGLLFLEEGSGDFTAQLTEPKDNTLSSLRLRSDNPILDYLGQKHKQLTGQNLATLPQFSSLWQQEKDEIKLNEIELLIPLISRDRLIGILVLDKKRTGRYSIDDLDLLEDVTNKVAVSIEKEYLREQLREREEELQIINRLSAIISSSLDIHAIYDSFIKELKKAIDISWAAITMIEKNDIYIMALYSEIGSPWQLGERVPIKGTATEWIATRKKTIVESDLSQETRFASEKYHISQGVHSIAYLPLVARGEAIGSLVVASRHPNAYSKRHIKLLEQLASQISMPVENSRLYAKTEEKTRIDELTGLLNRRSLDEMLTSEIGRHSRYGGIFSLIILDLDSFKAFNDSYGHLAGDKLLKQTGSIMKSAIRGADQAFRHGGDEFAILLPQTNTDDAYQVAERVRKLVSSEMKTGHIPVTASIGLASWPADGIGLNEIITTADTALYHAKRNGGNESHIASGTLLPLDTLDDTIVDDMTNEDNETLSTIYALAAAVDAKDHYTSNHSNKVKEYAVALAEAINMEPQEIDVLRNCALLHDIGKIGISDEILNKPNKLTAEEWKEIKTHPDLGATIANHVHQLAPCIPSILLHHERYDGSGYPKGLKGEDIPLEARILAIADAFAAITSDRHYSKALPIEEAIEEMKQGAGKQFDPTLVEVFLSIIKTTAATGERT
ncbi:diguanylate cyclase [Chloroflexota bacterium]